VVVTESSSGPIGVLVHGGTGRMGRAVGAAASESPGIAFQGVLDLRDRPNKPLEPWPVFEHIMDVTGEVDVVVDFSHAAAMGILVTALGGSGIALVSGTTGLGAAERVMLEEYSQEAPVVYDENMSYGISVLKKLLRVAGPLWRETADVEIVEAHRRGKRDYPSGTAYALARVLDPEARLVSGREGGRTGAERVLHGHSLRVGGVPGEHHVVFATEDEVMTISHRALSREVFARGALRAARFVFGREAGLYSMDDVIGV
jgi:4-hydroxy-tetrahydrodipicolinate reductase